MQHYDIAAYVWPSYTGSEPRARMFWPEGMGEWQSVKNAVSKFPGHSWPRRPLWGYVDEADPYVMEMEIEAAADHGVNTFIYDWYWYDGRPFLEQCLNNGFLKAKNNSRMIFYLMWANHNANSLWDIRTNDDEESIIWNAAIGYNEFIAVATRLVDCYFTQDNYYTIDGKPVFMIYDIANFIRGVGGEDAAKRALEDFRALAVAGGLPGLHLQMTVWSEKVLNLSLLDGNRGFTAQDCISKLGFDSVTHYQYVHFTDIDRSYPDILADVVAEWAHYDQNAGVPYFPHVSLGWDNNPRFHRFRPGIMRNNTPQNIRQALLEAKAYIDSHPNQPPLMTINSWNEWTESSYLQPDDLYEYGYLEAVRDVFKVY